MRKSRKALWGISEKGVIREGSDADIVVLDPEKESVISAKTHAYNTDNNPFEGFALHCAIDDVFLRGHHAVQDGKLKEENWEPLSQEERILWKQRNKNQAFL